MKTLALVLATLVIAGVVVTKIVGHHKTCSVRGPGNGTPPSRYCTTKTGLW